ncbi:MAG: alpha/beta hydrolase [Phycisphaerae bacterium]|nr:alpha/beta hydrolase [Phycisphaerae bacterium]
MAFAQTPTGRLYVESHGEGPALVIAPNLGATTRAYRGLLPNLTETHRVLLYDLHGMGKSDDAPAEITLTSLTDQIACVLDHYHIERASLMGLSMGTIIAQQFAVDHRERLERLVLVTPLAGRNPHNDRINEMFHDLLAACGPEKFMGYMINLALSPEFVNGHATFVRQMARRLAIGPRETETMLRLLRGLRDFSGPEKMARMDAATLIIAGGRDILTPREQAELLHQLLPNGELVVMEDVAHSPFIENTKETFALVRRFLTGNAAQRPAKTTPTTSSSRKASA